MIRRMLNICGFDIVYFHTNYGMVCSVRSLARAAGHRFLNSYDLRRYVKPELCTTVIYGRNNGILCTGLKGLKQIFADNPNEQLETTLISHGLLQGEMPYQEDIKVCENEFMVQQQKKIVAMQKHIAYLEKKISVLEKLQDNTTL